MQDQATFIVGMGIKHIFPVCIGEVDKIMTAAHTHLVQISIDFVDPAEVGFITSILMFIPQIFCIIGKPFVKGQV